MTRFASLASGSSGNSAVYVSERACILIDAGTNTKYIRNALATLGLSPADLTHVLVTHTHTDHISALPVLMKHTRASLLCTHTAAPALARSVPDRSVICPFTEGDTLALGDVCVTGLATPHDSEGSCCYLLGEGERRVAYCTDLGCMPHRLLNAMLGAPVVFLESNHDLRMLREGPYPYFLKKRILSERGHLSNLECAETAVELARAGMNTLLLAHLSEENNTPGAAQRESERQLAQAGFGAVSVTVAPRGEPSAPVSLGVRCAV